MSVIVSLFISVIVIVFANANISVIVNDIAVVDAHSDCHLLAGGNVHC